MSDPGPGARAPLWCLGSLPRRWLVDISRGSRDIAVLAFGPRRWVSVGARAAASVGASRRSRPLVKKKKRGGLSLAGGLLDTSDGPMWGMRISQGGT